MKPTRENNIEQIKKAQSGDKEALEELISANMGLCKSIALRFRDRGTEYEDLVQLASIGMIKAVRSFDFSYNTAFSTYAVPLIIGEIRRHLRDDGLIKVSRSIKKCGIDAMHKREEFISENGREPKVSELAALCCTTPEQIAASLEAISPVHSLAEPVGKDDDTLTIENMLSDKEDGIGSITDKIALAEAIKKLPEIQRQIVILRYFRELSQQQTGNILGMTQVKISREEKKIITQLRKVL